MHGRGIAGGGPASRWPAEGEWQRPKPPHGASLTPVPRQSRQQRMTIPVMRRPPKEAIWIITIDSPRDSSSCPNPHEPGDRTAQTHRAPPRGVALDRVARRHLNPLATRYLGVRDATDTSGWFVVRSTLVNVGDSAARRLSAAKSRESLGLAAHHDQGGVIGAVASVEAPGPQPGLGRSRLARPGEAAARRWSAARSRAFSGSQLATVSSAQLAPSRPRPPAPSRRFGLLRVAGPRLRRRLAGGQSGREAPPACATRHDWAGAVGPVAPPCRASHTHTPA